VLPVTKLHTCPSETILPHGKELVKKKKKVRLRVYSAAGRAYVPGWDYKTEAELVLWGWFRQHGACFFVYHVLDWLFYALAFSSSVSGWLLCNDCVYWMCEVFLGSLTWVQMKFTLSNGRRKQSGHGAKSLCPSDRILLSWGELCTNAGRGWHWKGSQNSRRIRLNERYWRLKKKIKSSP